MAQASVLVEFERPLSEYRHVNYDLRKCLHSDRDIHRIIVYDVRADLILYIGTRITTRWNFSKFERIE